MEELLNWLKNNQLDKYQTILIENDITNLELLSELTEDDIKELGFSLGDRKRFVIGIKELESNSSELSQEDIVLLNSLPYVIAFPLQQTLLEKNAPQRLNYFRDTFLNYLKYLGLLTASEFFNSPFKERKIVDLFLQNLAQPSFGSWNAFTRECLLYLKTQNHTFFCPDLADYYETVETGKKRKMYNGEIEVVDSYNGGETKYIKQTATGIGMLINFRNRYLGHGLTLDAATSEKLWNDYFPFFRTLLEQLTFCEKFPMLKQEAAVYYSLQGIEIKPFESNVTIDSNVSLYNRDTNASMPIIPFFIIPGELAIESDEKANIMSYESNNGKTITFFSPEGITKQTSGKLLERLNLLLRDKQKEIPFTPETFTKEVFAERIAEENQLMLKSLLNEKKVIEGIYQHREEMEIKLREWIGARANIFFIAAEAGSGKTNLLVEIQKQYAARNLTSLLIRAARMEKPSLIEELCYQLNMDYSLDIAQYTALAGTQSEPTFILIDGLNESSNAEAIWQEILEFSSAFEPGSLKFIITSRANTKTDLDRYVLTEDQIQYLYGENKDHETSLSGFAFWLTPLDMKEMESAWETYVAKDKNRFKPLFSFNDIATFDRGLYLQINNPLVLRIFLETYKGKNLPKKGTKHLHVWKDWFATFSNEEQKFMSLLADAVWEQGENELLLDTVLNNKNLQSYFLNDNTNAPYQRLLTLGWISRYVKDLTVYVSFTVEGLLLYLLGTKLNQQNTILSAEDIDEILDTGTKLQKSAIESFLCEQTLEGKIDIIAQLIDEGEKKLELCVTPFLYFLKSQGVERTIDKLLENPTENDWKFLLELDKKIYNLELHILRRQLLEVIMPLNPMISKSNILLGLKAISLFDKDNAIFYLTKIDTTSKLLEDADLLTNLGVSELSIENFETALKYLEKALDLRLIKFGLFHQSVAECFGHIEHILGKLGHYDMALENLQQCYEIEKTIFSENHYLIAGTLNNFGLIMNIKSEYSKALEYYNKSLEISIKNYGIFHSSIATTYSNLGCTMLDIGDFEKALDYFEKSLVIYLNIFGESHNYVGSVYDSLGTTWNYIGNCEKAIEYHEKSISMSSNEKTSNTGISYNNLGLVYHNIGDFEEALNCFEKSLIIYSETLGSEHLEVGTTYNNIGLVWDCKGNYDCALEYYEKSLSIYKDNLGVTHPYLASTYNNIGSIFKNKGEYLKAIEYCEKSLEILLNKFGSEHPNISTAYYNIGNCYYALSEYLIAIENFLKGYNIEKKGGFPFQIAQCYEAINKPSEALNYYIQSAEIRKEDIAIDDEATQEAIANAKRLAKELGNGIVLPDWMIS